MTMTNEALANTIYVGNIQSISDEQLREYFQKFSPVVSIHRHCPSAQDEWLIDYRFVEFSPGTDLSRFISNQIDHTICRIRLDIQSYDVACRDETRLISDRKICIAHTDPKLNRNVVKKAFSRYGRILNCNCVSSGHGIEYVYIEFESINSVLAICDSNKAHYAGKTRLAVRRTLRPSKIIVKNEPTTQIKQSNRDENSSERSSVVSTRSSMIRSNESIEFCSEDRLKELEHEYNLVICRHFDDINDKIDKFIENQTKSYKTLRKDFLVGFHSSSDDDDVRSSSQTSDHRKKHQKPRH